jgi:hypothetical protein
MMPTSPHSKQDDARVGLKSNDPQFSTAAPPANNCRGKLGIVFFGQKGHTRPASAAFLTHLLDLVVGRELIHFIHLLTKKEMTETELEKIEN